MPKSRQVSPAAKPADLNEPEAEVAAGIPATSGDEVTPLDGGAFLEANRLNREKYRAQAQRKAAKQEAKAGRQAVSLVERTDLYDDRTPRRLDADEATNGKAGKRRSRKTIVAFVVLAVLVVALATSTTILAVAYRDADSRSRGATTGLDEQVQAAVAAASRYAVELTTYNSADFGDLDRRIEAISTPEFTRTYITSSQDAHKGNAAVKAVSTAKVDNAALMSAQNGKYVVLLALDQTITSPEIQKDNPQGIFYQSRVKMTVERSHDGRWLINDLKVV